MEPGTFLLETQCLNQLHHRIPQRKKYGLLKSPVCLHICVSVCLPVKFLRQLTIIHEITDENYSI